MFTLIVSSISLILSSFVIVRCALSAHRDYQRSRLESTGYAAPWFMCWAYWIGVDEKLFNAPLRNPLRSAS